MAKKKHSKTSKSKKKSKKNSKKPKTYTKCVKQHSIPIPEEEFYNMSSGFEKLFQMKAEETRREDKEESFNRLLQTARNFMNRSGLTASEVIEMVDASEDDKKKMLEMLMS